MKETKEKIGVTDLPCMEEEEDALGIVKYVNGLEKFIRKCPTPMSIAIQGDWGTGKTSTINMLQQRLEKTDVIRCVYFNTWQYSQFSMADDLYISFVSALVRRCCTKETSKEVLKIVQKIATKFFFNAVKEKVGLDAEEFFEKQKEKMENVEQLKSEFSKMIRAELADKENGRVVIFIDDLDRLNPQVAVELLEVIKLFMDVEKCIFVLAIDYDVVVSGVRSKYGMNVSDEKCRNFFDKIIQLPFRLPVEAYSLDGLVRKTVAEDIAEEDVEDVSVFVGEMLGSNPRAYKRLANSFFMIKNVYDKEGELENALLFSTLCIQMSAPKFYQLLVSVEKDTGFEEIRGMKTKEALSEYINSYNMDLNLDEKEERNILRCCWLFDELLKHISVNHKKEKNIYKKLLEVMKMTVITSVSTGSNGQKRATAQNIDKIVINGVSTNVRAANEAVTETYKQLLNYDLINDFINYGAKMLTKDADASKSIFRTKKSIYKGEDVEVFLGVSTGFVEKMRQTRMLCEFMNEKDVPANVVWYDGNDIVFDSAKM